jgi:hypothetical protein
MLSPYERFLPCRLRIAVVDAIFFLSLLLMRYSSYVFFSVDIIASYSTPCFLVRCFLLLISIAQRFDHQSPFYYYNPRWLLVIFAVPVFRYVFPGFLVILPDFLSIRPGQQPLSVFLSFVSSCRYVS